MLRLRTFGGLTLENGTASLAGAALQRAPLALLAAVAAAGPQGISRERLLALFWPESDEERARGSLKQAMYALRRDLVEPGLLLGTDNLRLNPTVIGSDIGEFEIAMREGELERAVELCRGPFLDGIHIGNGEFDRWRDEQADRLASRYRTGLNSLAMSAEQRGDFTGAVRWWRLLAVAEPLSTPWALSLMKALTQAGDRASALKHARIHEDRVRTDLEAEPDPALLRLADHLRRELESPPPDPAAPLAPFPRANPLAPTRRFRLWRGSAALFILAMSAGGILLMLGNRRLNADLVQLAPGDKATSPDSLFVAELAEVLTRNDRTLKVALGRSRRARYIATVSAWGAGDSVRFAVQLTDVTRGKRLAAIEPVTVAVSARGAGVQVLGERLGVALAAQRSHLFASWADAAVIPATWASFRALQAGIESWGAPEPADPIVHFDASAAGDPSSATPLIWKAFVFSRDGRADESDSVLTVLDSSRRRRGPWDQALEEVLRAWNRGDLAAAHVAGHRLLDIVPNSDWAIIPAWDAGGLGRQREALQLMGQVPGRDSWTRRWGDAVRFQALHLSADYAGELEVAHEGMRREPDSRWYDQFAVRALAGLGRVSEVERLCHESLALGGGPGVEWQPCQQAWIELWGHGHPANAEALAGKFIRASLELGTISAEQSALDRAETWAEVGQWERAGQALADASETERNGVRYLEALSLIQAARGDRGAVATSRNRLAPLRSVRDGNRAIGEVSMFEASTAALLGDKEESVHWIARAFREGCRFRTFLHWNAAFDKLHGYPPFEAFKNPVEDPEHRARFAANR